MWHHLTRPYWREWDPSWSTASGMQQGSAMASPPGVAGMSNSSYVTYIYLIPDKANRSRPVLQKLLSSGGFHSHPYLPSCSETLPWPSLLSTHNSHKLSDSVSRRVLLISSKSLPQGLDRAVQENGSNLCGRWEPETSGYHGGCPLNLTPCKGKDGTSELG